MTFRRRARSTRRVKTPVAWHVCGSAEPGFNLESFSPTVFTLGGGGISTHGLLAAARTSDASMIAGINGNERMRVERIRGEIHLHANAADSTVGYGIVVVNQVTGGGSYDVFDPQSGTDAAMPWLWLSHRFVRTASVGGPNNYVIPVDVKSRRILRPDQALVLMASVVSIAGNVEYTVNLRTLYSKVV